MILVTGAAGPTGYSVIRRLAARGADVRAFGRSAEGVQRAHAAGAREGIQGDLRSAGDVREALAGVDRVYHIGPNFQADEYEIAVGLIDAAKAEGVARFAFHSVIHPMSGKMPHHWEKLRVEEYLIESLVPYTVLAPTMYMQNVSFAWESILKTGVYRVFNNVDVAMSVVDLDDVGEAAAIVLTEDGWTGGSFELCSPYPLTQAEMATIFSEVSGRDIRAEKGDLGDWVAAAEARGEDAYAIDAFIRMCAHYDAYGLPGGNGRVLEMILGRKPNDYRAFAEKWWAAHKPDAV